MSDGLEYRDRWLIEVEGILKKHGVIDPKEKGAQLKAKLKWLYLIDELLSRPYIWEEMEEDEIEPSSKLDVGVYYLTSDRKEDWYFHKRLYKAKICLKIIESFRQHMILDATKFPKELEFEPEDDEPHDGGKDFYLKLSNKVIPILLEFCSIYYKFQLFNERFVCPILDMLKYTNITPEVYEKIKEEFDEFDFDLIELALFNVHGKIEHDSVMDLDFYARKKIYWIKSIAYMYRIPIPVELMKIVDDEVEDLYYDLNELEDKIFHGSPNCYDKEVDCG